MFGYLFLGFAFGVLMTQAGYSAVWCALSSVLIYAGSMQFILVELLASGAGLGLAAVMTLLINSRHLFYGLSFIGRFRGMGLSKLYAIFALTDETYSLLCSLQPPKELDANRVRLYIALLDHAYWVAGSAAGAILGSVIPFDLTGIDFAMTALFVVIFVDQWRGAKSRLPAIAGLGFGLLWLVVLGPDRFLLPALVCTMLVLLLCRGTLQPQTEEVDAP